MMTTSIKRKRREGGSSIVEIALLAPWIFFLFVGILDFGFYSYSSICTQNAARAVALAKAQTAASGVSACSAALGEMRMLTNVGYNPSTSLCADGGTSCPPTLTSSTVVALCVKTLNSSTTPACADCAFDTAAVSQQAEVTYKTIPLVPIPGLLTGQLTLSRGAEVRQTTP